MQVIVLFAHGTVESLEDLPAFVAEIRHGRPAPPGLVSELRSRYEHVGGSPLLRLTRELAAGVAQESRIETRVAMRLWNPRLNEVTADLGEADEIFLVPLAPFSVAVYERAARAELARRQAPPKLFVAEPFGRTLLLIDAWAQGIIDALDGAPDFLPGALICSAHSLPSAVIAAGDTYEAEFRTTAALVFARLRELRPKLTEIPMRVAFQSQGAMDGAWLGPSLSETLTDLRHHRAVCVAPIGFLSEHIETLYDLDVEARAQADALGLGWLRVPALNTSDRAIRALAQVALRARLAAGGGSN